MEGFQSTSVCVCVCGRSFSQTSAFNNHKRTCQASKKRLSNVLDKAKNLWKGPKRRRLQPEASTSSRPLPGLVPETSLEAPTTILLDNTLPQIDQADTSHDMTMMERKPWTHRLHRQLPLRFRDTLPQPPPPLPPPSLSQSIASTNHSSQSIANNGMTSSLRSSFQSIHHRLRLSFTTGRNIFGLSRRYNVVELPSRDPEEHNQLNELSDIPSISAASTAPSIFHPYPNRSSFRLGDWYWNGSTQKSQASFKELLEIIGDREFQSSDIRGTKWDEINRTLASDDKEEWLDAEWIHTPVTISVPYHLRRGVPPDPHAGPQNYTVADFYHRSLVSVIRDKLSTSNHDQHFHYDPYELNWQPGETQQPARVQGELYTSPAFLDAHRELQDSPAELGCDLPRVVVALMFWSDVTHLTSFGDAKLWPLYLFFGNESKYRRCKPSCNMCHHVAYFQSLPDAFKDFATTQTAGGKTPSDPFMTHCARELMHAQWMILLDDEFLEAWTHGIVITCCDGIKRRFYPRIFTYSADYPEKILLASIRNLGRCPCPRCLVQLYDVHDLGTPLDMQRRATLARVDDHNRKEAVAAARKLIYDGNHQVNSAAVEKFLKGESLVPNMNAFSNRLSPLGFNLFAMLVVDLMHEFELGVWRAIFIHLLRILESHDGANLIAELDCRYRQMPAFGKDSIRRFSANSSELKNMAARKLENLLQCAIPVFDELLPEPHNQQILELLFVAAHWHALAKLRMHNDLTLNVMDDVTVSLGEKLRTFNDLTCSAFVTRELKREFNARTRREAKKTAAKPTSTAKRYQRDIGQLSRFDTDTVHQPRDPSTSEPENPLVDNKARLLKKFNLNTYKCHALGDYTTTIRRYGTTDSYSTELGELEHRSPKARYTRTSRKGYLRQITQIERRQTRVRQIRERHRKAEHSTQDASPPNVHHVIGKSQNHPESIPLFLRKYSGDPAVKDFIPKLQDHLLPRIKALLSQEAASAAHVHPPDQGLADVYFAGESRGGETGRNSVLFKNDLIYRHHLVRINYTTYDVRRSQDVINPKTPRCDVMLLANDPQANANHPFLYGRVLGVFHANVIYTGPGMLDYAPRRLEFLWVRWFQYIGNHTVDWKDHRLDCVQFPPTASDNSFGFVDPKDVLRGCYIVPRFARGKVHADGIGISRCADDAGDWCCYHVIRFADRDMLMRYHWGLAVGHVYAHHGGIANSRATNAVPSNNSSSNPDLEATRNPHRDSDPTAEAAEICDEDTSDTDQPELDLRNRNDDEWEDVEGSYSDGSTSDQETEESSDYMPAATEDLSGP